MFKTQNLYQNDAKWKNEKLGDASETIGEWGGLLTSITMMLNGIGYKEETPQTVNEKLKQEDGFLKALPSPSHLGHLWPNCVFDGMTRCENSDAPIEKIDAAVAAGKPVILEVDSKEETGNQTHFVLVKDKKGDDYLLYDPDRYGDTSDKEVLLTKRYRFNEATLKSEIQAVLWFDLLSTKLPVGPVAKIPIPREKYTLFATEDDLILRNDATVDSFPWKRMAKWTDLICLESRAVVQAKRGVDGKWIRVQEPDGNQGFVSASFLTEAPIPPQPGARLPRKKWCLKNVSLQNPVMWDQDKKIIESRKLVKSFNMLLKDTVVSMLKPDEDIPGWSGVMYEETYYDSGVKGWVNVGVTGWVRDADLDDFREHEREEFRDHVLDIPRQTQSSTDAQQYFYIDDGQSKARYNMCGELSIAFVAGKDIDTVLNEWRDHSKASRALYDSKVGNADQPLGIGHMEDLLNVHVGELGTDYERYKSDKVGKPLKDYINLADPNDDQHRSDQRLAHERLKERLKGYYFITNLKINTHTGDLEEAHSADERNHWVVVDEITRNGSRVELYNPFPNRREEYSFGELYRSIGGDPNSGWWIKRDNPKFNRKETAAAPGIRAISARPKMEPTFQPPTFEVMIDNRTENAKDAEQYLYIRGEGSKPKTKLCGEFSVSFILGQSLQISLKRWLDGQGKQAGIQELVTLLQAYGFNRRKYLRLSKDQPLDREKYYVVPNQKSGVAPDQMGYIKSFSIDTVLEYWKDVQTDLYNSILGDNRNEPTGLDDLMTILKAYGYRREDYSYYRPGSKELFGYAPGRDAEALKTHFLIAGVSIDGTTGRLRATGVGHWVVVTKLTPQGNLIGGNGGWVELYNPFPNCWEEYSYREFMKSCGGFFTGATLWVKRDISPVFTRQTLAPAKIDDKGPAKNVKAKATKNRKADQKNNKKRKSGKGKNQPNQDANSERETVIFDVSAWICEHLGVDSIPAEVEAWISDTCNGDQFFAEELADALLESGIVSIQEQIVSNKKSRTAVLTDPKFSSGFKASIKKSIDSLASSEEDPVFSVASAVLPRFTAMAIDGINKRIREKVSA